MGDNLSIFSLIVSAGVVVQIIMLILVLMSVYSWTLIFAKNKTLLNAVKDIKESADDFFQNLDLEKRYSNISNSDSPIAKIFTAGYTEFIHYKPTESQAVIENCERAYRSMNIASSSEVDRLDDGLSVLAMIASSSPYIGLFGTVWGIMHSFIGLATVKQATIAIVAPGIAEALIATAFGLFAAIPATIAYNRLTSRVWMISNEYTAFSEKLFINLQKQQR